MRGGLSLLAGLVLGVIGAAAFGAQQPYPDFSGYATAAQVQAAQSTANAAQAAAGAVPTDYLGAFTLASLPSASANAGKRALVTDLGGGPGYLRASNGCWRRVATTTAAVQSVPVAATATIDGLSTSPIVALIGSAFAARATITVTNACSMPQLTIVAPAGVFSALGTLGLAVNGGNALTVNGIGTAGTWADFAVSADGSTLTKIRGGSL